MAFEKLVSSTQTSFHKTAYVSIIRKCTCQRERKLFPVARKMTLACANVGAYFLPYAQHVSPLFITAATVRHSSFHAITFPDTDRSCSVWTGYTIPWAGISQSVQTRYDLDCLGFESRSGRDFPHVSRPALGSTQRPVQWVLGSFRGGRAAETWCWPTTPL